MAAQVLSGQNNLSYTNSTGQNVRLVINWLKTKENCSGSPTIAFPGTSIVLDQNAAFGKHLGTYPDGNGAHRDEEGTNRKVKSVPLEIALANGDTFSINSSSPTDIDGYNIIIVPEAG